MNVRKLAGLVGAGGVGRSFLARMPALLERIGPVKGASLRVSRRIANGLRAGTGVTDPRLAVLCTEGFDTTLGFFAGKSEGFSRESGGPPSKSEGFTSMSEGLTSKPDVLAKAKGGSY